MKILFIHPQMPAQYKHLARALAEHKNNQVFFLTSDEPWTEIPGVKKITYKVPEEPSAETHPYLIRYERGILVGQETWKVCKKLKEQGFIPDIICAHPGWGNTLFLKGLYQDTPILNYQEFFYSPAGPDVNFLPEDVSDEEELQRIKINNSINLMGITDCDWGISPTFWQRDQFPKEFHSKISVLHDGIDTDLIKPLPTKWDTIKIPMPGVSDLKYGDEIITYIARSFEPYRGIGTFMEAADIILKKRPNARILAIGGDDPGYGKQRADGQSWRSYYTNKVNPDMSRLHFLGHLSYNDMLSILQVSSAHIYLTAPFVLSWSMLEAMSAGCAIVASKTEPVKEVIEDGKNGLLADFFSPEDVANKVEQILDAPDGMQPMRNNARQTIIDRYDMKKLLPLHIALIRDIANKKLPPRAAKLI